MARPRDNEQRKTGSKGRAIVHFRLNPEHWDYKEETGNDYGRDCIIELSEDDEWRNHKVEGQIKGTGRPSLLSSDEVSFPMQVKTIEYALGSPVAFILFVADTSTEDVYYQCVQDYFIHHTELFEKLGQETINIRIPVSHNLKVSDDLLQKWAKATYVDGPGHSLKQHKQELTTVFN